MRRMRRRLTLGFLLLAALWVAAGQGGPLFAAGEPEAKHHHDLRGVITKVEPKKNEFKIKTDAGRVVLCLIDDKTRLKRGSEKISLKDVRPGERARCHCSALRNGRHYSQSLLLEAAKEKKEK